MQQFKIYRAEELAPFLPTLEAAEAVAVKVLSKWPDKDSDNSGEPAVSIQLATAEGPELELDYAAFLPTGLGLLQKIFSTRAVKVFARAELELPYLLALGLKLTPPVL